MEILAEKIGHAVDEGDGVTVDFGLAGREEGKERLAISPSGFGSDEEEGGLA